MSNVTEDDVRDWLHMAGELFGWPRHVTDSEKAERVVAAWAEWFVGSHERELFNQAFRKALFTKVIWFPAPSQVEAEYVKLRAERAPV